jgi:pimeloyl-ACP methyl ester carboxylesterase
VKRVNPLRLVRLPGGGEPPAERSAQELLEDALLEPDLTVLPSPSELDLTHRALYHGSVLSDYVMRTALSSMITAATIPSTLTADARVERRRLEFYAALAAQRDVNAVFEPPPASVKIRTEIGRGPEAGGGRVELVRFASPFVPVNPDVRRDYLRHEQNQTARAQHWRHDGGPRPTLIVIHGFGASPAWFNTMFFSLNEFFSAGWDILLFTMPFHGGRRSPRAPFNGAEIFAGSFSWLNEGILQAITDLRVLLAYLRSTGAPRAGVTGLSLGGYTTAVLASVADGLDFAVPNATVCSVGRVLRQWFPSNVVYAGLRRAKGLPPELLNEALSIHSPLMYEPRLPRERLMVVAGLGDRLTPPEHSVMLWEHWGKPQLRWFPGSHILHFERGSYLEAMRELMSVPRESIGSEEAAA